MATPLCRASIVVSSLDVKDILKLKDNILQFLQYFAIFIKLHKMTSLRARFETLFMWKIFLDRVCLILSFIFSFCWVSGYSPIPYAQPNHVPACKWILSTTSDVISTISILIATSSPFDPSTYFYHIFEFKWSITYFGMFYFIKTKLSSKTL